MAELVELSLNAVSLFFILAGINAGQGLTIVKNEKYDGPKKHRKRQHYPKQ
jgi:hypothetical protein